MNLMNLYSTGDHLKYKTDGTILTLSTFMGKFLGMKRTDCGVAVGGCQCSPCLFFAVKWIRRVASG